MWIREKVFDAFREWHCENVNRYGQCFTTPELIPRSTGESVTADHFVDYATGKYTDLYGL